MIFYDILLHMYKPIVESEHPPENPWSCVEHGKVLQDQLNLIRFIGLNSKFIIVIIVTSLNPRNEAHVPLWELVVMSMILSTVDMRDSSL